jgi:hypothetical protein
MITAAQIADLQANVDLWAGRDPGASTASVRAAANDIVTGIDQLLHDLYLLRGRTVSEMRTADDLAAARVEGSR